MSSVLQVTAELIAARANGYTTRELATAQGLTDYAAAKRLQVLEQRGQAHRVRVPGGNSVRFFATAQQAQDWAAQAMPTPRSAMSVRERVVQAAQLAGEAGTNVGAMLTEWPDIPTGSIGSAISAAEKRGEIQVVYHQGWRMVWAAGITISQGALADMRMRVDRYLAERARIAATARHRNPVSTTIRAAQPAPVKATPHRPEGEADDSRAVVTRCPSPTFTARWQYRNEAPDERWPSFTSIPLGGTLSQPQPITEAA